MTSEIRQDIVELEQPENTEDAAVVVERDGVFIAMLRGLFWPFGLVMRTFRGFWWVLGFRQPQQRVVVSPAVCSPARQNLSGRKRLHRITRILLSVLPRWVQSTLGYPVSSSIGCSLSPEIRVSPTKPCGKGSKRKQDELDEDDDDDEEETQTWVEAFLNQELAVDEGSEEDPDFEPTTIETESEEYCSQNNTDSELEVNTSGTTETETEGEAVEHCDAEGHCEECALLNPTDSDMDIEGKSIVIEDVNAGIEVS